MDDAPVLIVDDNVFYTYALVTILEQFQVKCQIAHTG